jgi:DNA-binding SARP family transcriptional activator
MGPDLARYETTVAAARAVLGAEFARHWDAGASRDLEGAFVLAAEAVVVDDAVPGDAPMLAAVPTHDVTPVAPPSPPSAARAAQPAPDVDGRLDIEVRAFGPLAVARDGVQVPPTELTPAKVRELLLHLVVHPAGRTKEQIALALWPDASPAQLRNAFHVTMHQLRRALGHKEAVTFDGGRYALARAAGDAWRTPGDAASGDAPGVRDVDAVLAASDAVRAADRELGRGGRPATTRPAGPDAGGPDAGGPDAGGPDAGALARWRSALDAAARGALGEGEDAGEWLAAPLARVTAAWVDGMEALARLHVARGAPREAAAVLEALVAAEPLREGAHRTLMATYAAAGEPARALAHYDALTALLAREVGAAPGRETTALAASIRGNGRPA